MTILIDNQLRWSPPESLRVNLLVGLSGARWADIEFVHDLFGALKDLDEI